MVRRSGGGGVFLFLARVGIPREECDAWYLGAGGSEQQDLVFLPFFFLFFVLSSEIKRAPSAD